jgi:2-dehydro-3-deoxyphosphogluconate aldolase/(4S)-4-hydroxy-2-oxoglutarate aldolase
MIIEDFKRLPIMGILRGIGESSIAPLTECMISSGLKTVEIAMNTPGAPALIKQMAREASGRLTIGAGTVLDDGALKAALEAGATFIVSPVFVPEVVNGCVRRGVPVFPGAFTPQEVYLAYKEGAAMVKVFPSKALGPEYIRELKGPFDNIKLLACGGVSPANLKDFFECGASAVAFGGSVFKKADIAAGRFDRIEASIKELINEYK